MPASAGTEKITEEQANAAFQQLAHPDESESAQVTTAAPEPPAAEAPAAETVQAEAAVTEGAEGAVVESDDLVSLKKRLDDSEARGKQIEEQANLRTQALQQRQAESERILRDRYIRKATVADKALKTLRASRSEQGVPEADVDRVISELESTMHPSSASYVPPETRTATTEDQALVLNSFLNEKGMTGAEADEFGTWMRTEAVKVLSPREQELPRESLDGFLRIAHNRWQEGVRESVKETKRSDAVVAVQSVQRVQREAAKAASASPTGPRKQPAGKAETIDVAKLTRDDVSALLKQSVEQFR
jgi:hypothetical protein